MKSSSLLLALSATGVPVVWVGEDATSFARGAHLRDAGWDEDTYITVGEDNRFTLHGVTEVPLKGYLCANKQTVVSPYASPRISYRDMLPVQPVQNYRGGAGTRLAVGLTRPYHPGKGAGVADPPAVQEMLETLQARA